MRCQALSQLNRQEPFGFGQWNIPQKRRVDDREHRCVEAHRKPERDNRRDRKAAVLREQTDREAQVLPQCLEPDNRTDVAHLFLHTLQADQSSFEARGASGLVAAHAAAHLLRDGRRQERAQLEVQIRVRPPPANERLRPTDGAPEPPHQNSPSEAFRIRPIAAVWISHARVSRLSMARPELVSA